MRIVEPVRQATPFVRALNNITASNNNIERIGIGICKVFFLSLGHIAPPPPPYRVDLYYNVARYWHNIGCDISMQCT